LALAMCEKTLGADHPAVAKSLNNLAQLYLKLHRYTEAEPLFREALAIREKRLGPDHPEVAITLKSYSALLRDTKRKSEAKELSARAKDILDRNQKKGSAEYTVDIRDLEPHAKAWKTEE